mgnify:CR=1 FL=1
MSNTLIYSSSVQGWDYRYSSYTSVKKIAALKNIFSYYSAENEYSNIQYYLLNQGIPRNKMPQGVPKSTLDTNLSAPSFRDGYMIAQTSADAWEVRLRLFANMFVEKPSAFGVLQNYISP